MTCENLHKKVLENDLEDAAVKAHLEMCADCRLAVETMDRFVAAKPDIEQFRIPRKLDDYITSEAKAFIDERKNHIVTSLPKHQVNPIYRWASVFAYAACFLLVAWMLIIALTDSNTASTDKNSKSQAKKSTVLDQEIRAWDNLDMSDEIFILNAEIEINFASLSFSDDEEVKKVDKKEDEDFLLELPDLMI